MQKVNVHGVVNRLIGLCGRLEPGGEEGELRIVASSIRERLTDLAGVVITDSAKIAEQTAAECSPPQPDFVSTFSGVAHEVHQLQVEKGFWDGGERNNGEVLALIHSELTECLEALRQGNPPDDKILDFTGAEAELADAVIRIMDLAAARGWRLAEAILAKHHFNRSRPYKHGKKF